MQTKPHFNNCNMLMPTPTNVNNTSTFLSNRLSHTGDSEHTCVTVTYYTVAMTTCDNCNKQNCVKFYA